MTSFLQYFVLIALQIFVTPIVLHLGGKEVLGGYSFIMQIVAWAGAVDLGFGVAISRVLSQAHGLNDDHQHFRSIFASGRTYYIFIHLAFSSVVFLVGFFLANIIKMSAELQVQGRWSLFALALYSELKVPLILYNEGLNATQNMAVSNMIVLVGNVLRLLMSIVFVYLGLSLFGLMLSYIAADLLTSISQRVAYKAIFPRDRMGWGFTDSKMLKEMILFGLTFMLMQLAGRLTTSTDSLLVGFVMGAGTVAVYYTSQMPGTVLYQAAWKIADNVQSGLNDLYANRNFQRIKDVYSRVLVYSLCIAFGLAFGLLLFNERTIGIWVGPHQYAGGLFTFLLAVYAIMQILFYANSRMLIVYGQIRVISTIGIVTGLAKLGMGFGFLKLFGLPGLLLAFILGDLPNLVYSFVKTFQLLQFARTDVVKTVATPVAKVLLLPSLFLLTFLVLPIRTGGAVFVLSVAGFVVIWLGPFVRYALSASERSRIIAGLLRR